jgi:hypothetical protein
MLEKQSMVRQPPGQRSSPGRGRPVLMRKSGQVVVSEAAVTASTKNTIGVASVLTSAVTLAMRSAVWWLAASRFLPDENTRTSCPQAMRDVSQTGESAAERKMVIHSLPTGDRDANDGMNAYESSAPTDTTCPITPRTRIIGT